MQLGIESFVINTPGPATNKGTSTEQRMANLLDEIECADQAGLYIFGIGEHHRADFADSAPAVILAAAAGRTKRIRLTSAVTVLSALDPVRGFQEFARLDLLSKSRAEIIAGRGSFIDAYPLFALPLEDYESLFSEKIELLLKNRENTTIQWSGKHRPPLAGQGVYPHPVQASLPIWLGVGGTPESYMRAGTLGLRLMIAIIGGDPKHFRSLVDIYREAGEKAGHSPDRLSVGVHALGYVADTNEQAAKVFAPGHLRSFNEVGKQRGWGPTTRAHFDAAVSPRGALLVGDPGTVAKKILAYNTTFGGVSRVTFQMSVAGLSHERALKAIERIGSKVMPLVE